MSIKDNYYVEGIDSKETYEWIYNKHYAHRLPNIMFAFGLFNKNKILQGVCTFGMPPLTSLDFICDNLTMNDILELNRLVVNEKLEKNVLSFFVSSCLKLLPKNRVILSFADQNKNHHGYIYQATNWLYTGLGSIGSKGYVLNNKEIHSRHINKQEFFISQNLPFNDNLTIDKNFVNIGGEIIKFQPKFRYIMINGDNKFKKKIIKTFKLKILPYPKGDNIRYDASYKPIIQNRLF